MIKRFMTMATTSVLSFMMLSSFWDMPFCGPSAFFFGDPPFSAEIK